MTRSRWTLFPPMLFCSLAFLVAADCGGPKPITKPVPRTPKQIEVAPRAPAARLGLAFSLGQGGDQAGPRPVGARLAPATPLSASATEALLARLKPLAKDPADEQEFAIREGSLPPPRTGKTVKGVFPPPEAVKPPSATQPETAGPLEVLRYSPEGEVPLAPHLSLTFSQPMVAVTSHAELAKQALPARLTPEPPGKWRWVGTKTLLFSPDGRFPMATKYRVEIPAGTRSAQGNPLAKPVGFEFATPPPTLVRHYPGSQPVRLDTPIFLEFDQKIDPAAVLPTLHLNAGSRREAKLRLARPEEIEASEEVAELVRKAQTGRFLVVRGEQALPEDSAIGVVVGPGTPSVEGPRKTEKLEIVSFRTYGPMKVVEHRCGWRECRPGQSFSIRFSNPVDEKLFRKSMVQATPEIPGLRVTVSGQYLSVSGRTRGRTTYKLTLAAELPDRFGQILGQEETLSFSVERAQDGLWASRQGFVVLDPAARGRFAVLSVNHAKLRVRMYSVGPEDWKGFGEYMRDYNRHENQRQPPGKQIADTRVPVQAEPDEMVETAIDLGPALGPSGLGQLIVIVEPTSRPKERWRRQVVEAWVQATAIGLDAFVDDSRLVAWATALGDGRPLAEVAVSVRGAGIAGKTGRDGLCTLDLGGEQGELLVARRGDDLAILPESLSFWGSSGWKQRPREDRPLLYVFDDRKMYRPGEEVKLKGWLRYLGGGPEGDVGMRVAGSPATISYRLLDSRRNEVAKGSATLDGAAGFHAAIKLPPVMNLGHATLELSGYGDTHRHTFQVQEFRRPEFEVTASASEGPHLSGGHAEVTLRAAYYAGGALPGAPVQWRVTSSPGHFTPPNRDDFVFGAFVPWWELFHGGDDSESDEAGGREVKHEPRLKTLVATTDSAGKHVLRIDLGKVNPARATSLRAEATVTDVNRQAWTASSHLVVHPAALYVGLRSKRAFYEQGQEAPIEAIVTDLDGKLVAQRAIELRAERVEWDQEEGSGKWKEKLVVAEDCALQSGSQPVRCMLHPKQGGSYRVTATILDDQGRKNQTILSFWVAGGRTTPRRDVEQEKVTLIPDKKEYADGDIAEVLVLAPFAPAEGVLTLRRSGLLDKQRFSMSGASHTLRIPIRDRQTPNLHLQVDVVGAAARLSEQGAPDPKLPRRPAYATGSLNLSIPPRSRTLSVEAKPAQARLEPGGNTSIDVLVRDAAGKPVAGSALAVVVVDEAILALTGYRIASPLSVFYGNRESGVRDHHLRASVALARPKDTIPDTGGEANMAAQRATGGMPGVLAAVEEDSDRGRAMPPPAPSPVTTPTARYAKRPEAAEPQPIRMRTDLSALALFAPEVRTDAAGHARVEVKLPDSLTRYRVSVVAVAGEKQFGAGESTITARLPLMVRPSAPRFLNFGDRFELPVVVQNQTDAALAVDVAVRAQNAELTAGAGRRVQVPANDRVEVRFPVATARAGTARFQVASAAARFADASELSLPVWTPATTEAFATYGQLDQNGAIAQPVRAPAGVFPQFGGLELTESSTALQALTDAVLYLTSYPFECAEQLSSRILGIAALRDVLTAFQAEGLPKPEEMIAAVARDLARLRGLQNDDGGFGFWRRHEDSWPYISIHVAHALTRAKEKGFEVPAGMLERAQRYLRDVERHIPHYYGPEARRVLVSYALYVRNRMGDRDPAKARTVWQELGVKSPPLEAVGWLLPVLSGDAGSQQELEAIRRLLRTRVTETAAAAHFATSYSDGAHLLLHSDRRADAILLEALIGDQPKSDLIPKLVEGLLGHRVAGRWGNTQENVFVLLALDRYFNTYEKVTPNFVARAWLGAQYAGEHAFRGRSTERFHIDIPMRALAAAAGAGQGGAQGAAKGPGVDPGPGAGGARGQGDGSSTLILGKQGPGRLYYRIGMRYAPRDLKLPAADHGFTVERIYQPIDDPADVRRDADGTWRVKAGARVRVRLTMVAPTRRYHVALVDPLPAGLEALNPALAVTGTIPQDTKDPRAQGRGFYWFWFGPWYQHQNLRDERAEAFTTLLWEGVHNYSYVARATTPGNFVVPPPKAEEMYHPETFGRGAGDRLIVE